MWREEVAAIFFSLLMKIVFNKKRRWGRPGFDGVKKSGGFFKRGA
jgi:hypothetical protein